MTILESSLFNLDTEDRAETLAFVGPRQGETNNLSLKSLQKLKNRKLESEQLRKTMLATAKRQVRVRARVRVRLRARVKVRVRVSVLARKKRLFCAFLVVGEVVLPLHIYHCCGDALFFS